MKTRFSDPFSKIYAPTPFLPLLICGISVGVVLSFWTILPGSLQSNESSDFEYYESVARNILAGSGITMEDGSLALKYPPGYPLVLAGMFGLAQGLGVTESYALSVFMLVWLALAALLLFAIARQWWTRLIALGVVVVWITYPFTLWLTKQPNSEIPFFAALFAACLLVWVARPARYYHVLQLLSGVSAGCAMLIRPIAVGLGLVLALGVWISLRSQGRRAQIMATALILIGNVLTILPWETWVYVRTGRAVFLSQNDISSIRDGLTFGANLKDYRQAMLLPPEVVAVMQDVAVHKQELQGIGDVAALMVGELQTQPLGVLQLFFLKAARSWYATDSGRYEMLGLGIQSIYLALVLLATWRAWHLGGEYRILAWQVWLVVGYFWLMTCSVLSISRYMTPAIGLLFLLLPSLLPSFVIRSPSLDKHIYTPVDAYRSWDS
jgi:hypothetical protein